ATTPAEPPAADAQPVRRPPFGDEQFGAFRHELTEFLRAEGAAVLLQDAGKPHGLLNMSGGWPRDSDRGNAQEPLPSAYVTHDHYAMLYRLASRAEPAKTRVEIEIANKITPGPITVYNTVGELKG